MDAVTEWALEKARCSGRADGLKLACDLLKDVLTHEQRMVLLNRAMEELLTDVPIRRENVA